MAWQANSWQTKAIEQKIIYNDAKALQKNLDILSSSATLINYASIKHCIKSISKADFIIQIGDCAEILKNNREAKIYAEAMSLFIKNLTKDMNNVALFARMAGQMNKPRSQLNSAIYRGDMLNDINTQGLPIADRLLECYNYAQTVISNTDTDIYLCHEALNLYYEQALVRQYKGINYASSAHLLWVGERTRQIDNAHIEFCRGIANPIAVKIGAMAKKTDILALAKLLNPKSIKGKLIFISRMGWQNIDKLYDLIKATKDYSKWLCDPMHGNTKIVDGQKTRSLEDIIKETKGFIKINKELKIKPAGIHIEATFEPVFECYDDNLLMTEKQSGYKSYCDPRLNLRQTEEYFFFLKKELEI